MTSDHEAEDAKLERLNDNLAKVEELSQRLVAALSQKAPPNPSLEGPGQELYLKAGTAMMAEMMQNPSKIYEEQVAFWSKSVKHFMEAQQALVQGKLEAPEDPGPEDRRFTNPLWRSHPYFNFVKRQYQLNSEAMERAVAEIEGVEGKDRQRLEYFTRQIIDMFAPTNFLGTNPDALSRAVETEGESLVKGLENLVRDIEANNGEVLVSLADKEAFSVGENIATAEGEVVFRNRMMELIQFSPKTETVHKTPIVLFPPWINKFYILDLKPANSLIRWVVEQGYTLFVVSWVNPDASFADVGLDTYVEEGYLTAIDTVKKITKEPAVNAVGYCVAGTVLSLTLALLKKRKDTSIKSATFFTTLTDFEDQGEFGVFLTDDFVDGIEEQVKNDGILKAYFMSRTFSFLRSNDLIYTPAIKSYMMGEAPPAFDLLYWNGDSTNLPGRMTLEYLRSLCQKNEFARDGFEILGEKVKLSDIAVPVCAIACETDHIAAWKSSFDGIKQFGSKSKTFILSQSGHIAGIVNPPSKKKYGHYMNDGPMTNADEWYDSADFHEGSWWPHWDEWLSGRSGKQVAAREPGDSKHKPICPAPGTYVLAKPNT
ncbi:PHA/PHB synthase family protein [Aliiroseovarius sp. YM-037]|uniref:PHA/PHB synthase family protein n=1 Tax=Aliiroseovarius sp. YM-037 TaxID=3341728 RepID=UPI003A801A88